MADSPELANRLQDIAAELMTLAQDAGLGDLATGGGGVPFIDLFTAFVLACFVGYFVVWAVTPALHSPLMAVTNAISSVIIVGALLAAGHDEWTLSKWYGFVGVVLASINIFGGFMVTHRMLSMFRKKK